MSKVQDLASFRLPAGFRGRPGWYVQLWMIVQALLFHPSPQILYPWRAFLLRLFGAKVGKNSLIRPSATFTYPWKIEMGDNVWIGDDAVIYSLGEISIGDDVVVSQRSYLCSGSHDMSLPSFDIFTRKIVIEAGAWIAADVFVAPGITIGAGCVVGARSSVFRDLPPLKVCTGNPARVIKDRPLSGHPGQM